MKPSVPMRKNLLLSMLIGTFGLYLLISFGINLPYQLANTDAVLYYSILPELLHALQTLAETAVYAIGFSILIFCFFSRVPRTGSRLFLIYAAAVVFRRLCDLSVTLIVFESIGAYDIFYCVFYLIPDLLFGAIASLLAHLLSKRFYRTLAKGDKKITNAYDSLYPFHRFISRKNPVQEASLILACLILLVRFVDRLIFDIQYGAPADLAEIGIMLAYYAADFLIAVGFYALSLLTLKHFFRQAKQTDTKENQEEQ